MSTPGTTTGGMANASPSRHLETRTVSDSEDAIRNLKASQSVESAFAAEGFGAPPVALAGIVADYVKSATRDIPLNQIANMSPGSGTLGTSAATGVTMFFSALTPSQRDAVKRGINPLDPVAMMKFNAMLNGTAMGGGAGAAREGGGVGRTSSEAYTRELAGGSLFKALGSEGYTPAQITGAIDYARSLGTTDDMARKLIKLDQSSRDDLQGFVNEVRNDASLTDEQKAEKVEEFRKAHPKIGKTLSKQDVLKVIRGDDKQQIKLRGVESSVHDDSQEQKFEDKARLGVARQTENQHRADAAKSDRNPDSVAVDLAVFAAAASKAKGRDTASVHSGESDKSKEIASNETKAPEAAKNDGKTPRVPAKAPSLG